jgi:hypothetical protein
MVLSRRALMLLRYGTYSQALILPCSTEHNIRQGYYHHDGASKKKKKKDINKIKTTNVTKHPSFLANKSNYFFVN